jgi:putative transposase
MAPWSGKETGEHALLRQLMHVFEAGDIVLGDAYYGSFFLIAMLQMMNVDAVFPINGSRHHDFRKGKRLKK